MSERFSELKTLRFLLLGAVSLFLAHGVLDAMTAMRLNTNLQAGDQGAYLALALDQVEGRRLTDGNRHPLYPALLIPWADRTPAFFERAKTVGFTIGLLFVFGVVFREWRLRENRWSAVLAASFLTSHVQMLRTVSEIWCEPLLYLWVYLLWAKTDRIPIRKAIRKGAASGEPGPTPVFFLCGGIFSGLAYLTKGTGLQVAFFFWLTVFIATRDVKKTLAGFTVFLVVASPLLVWNGITYGNPLYNFATTHNMWFDEADEIWYDDPEKLPTLISYLRTHSPAEVAGRIVQGVRLELEMAFQLLVLDWKHPFTAPGSLLPGVFLGFKILVGAAFFAGIRITLKSPRRGVNPITTRAGWFFFGTLAAGFVLSFGWYARLTNEPRFLMTLVPIAVVLIARTSSRFLEQRKIEKVAAGIVVLFALLVLLPSGSAFRKSRTLPGPSLGPLQKRVIDRLNRLPVDSRIAFGPSHGLPIWLARGDLVWRPTPWKIGWRRFIDWLRREAIDYVLVDSETFARRPYLSPLARPDPLRSLGGELVFRDRDSSNWFLLYRLKTEDKDTAPQRLPDSDASVGGNDIQ